MTITISLPPKTEKKLLEAAAQSGVPPDAFARELIEAGLNTGCPAEQTSQSSTFDDILAPVRRGFAQSGMTEDELNTLFEEARDEAC